MLPCVNAPAAKAGTRTSPIDGENLNRLFPGDSKASPTAMIADYIEHHLLATADFAVDMHSGGKTLNYELPAVVMRKEAGESSEAYEKRSGLMRAFGAPVAYTQRTNVGSGGSFLSAAARQKVPAIGTELGGAGTTCKELVDFGKGGVLRALNYTGVLAGSFEEPSDFETKIYSVNTFDHYVYAYDDGVFEPWLGCGQKIEAKKPIGLIHFPETPLRDPSEVRCKINGTVLARRFPCATEKGDCLFQIGSETEHVV